MNFGAVLERVGGFLDGQDRPWAVVGGVGLVALGLGRMTLDLDIVVESEVQEGLVDFLEAEGYETLHRSAGFSNHLHPDPRRGRVDFVYVDGDTARRLFPHCRELAGPGGLRVRVPRPEHLAAMKAGAMRDEPARRFQELADVRFLLTLPGVDRDEVRGYFAKLGLEGLFDDLVSTL